VQFVLLGGEALSQERCHALSAAAAEVRNQQEKPGRGVHGAMEDLGDCKEYKANILDNLQIIPIFSKEIFFLTN
jgi:hypothetical protein